MIRGGTLVLLVLAMGVAACGKISNKSGTTDGVLASGIMGGTDVTRPNSYSQHVVFIQVRMGQGAASCTGSILDSQTILTAAHCVDGADAGAIAFALDATKAGTIPKNMIRQIDHVIIHPNYQSEDQSQAHVQSEEPPPPAPTDIPTVDQVQTALDQSGEVDYDIAVLHFTGGLPAGFSPVELATDASVVKTGQNMHMIGYGLSEVDAVEQDGKIIAVPKQSSAGQLRETDVAVAAYDTKVGMILTDTRKTGVCSGDSGGPSFMPDSSGKAVQVGIAEAVANSYCNSVSMHTAIFPFLTWIKQSQQQLESQTHSIFAGQ